MDCYKNFLPTMPLKPNRYLLESTNNIRKKCGQFHDGPVGQTVLYDEKRKKTTLDVYITNVLPVEYMKKV